MQKAGPELLIPAPPYLNEQSDNQRLIRHGEDKVDPHVIDDRNKLFAKIEQDAELKVLERPNLDVGKALSSSSSTSPRMIEHPINNEAVNSAELAPQSAPIVTVPPAPSDHYPLIIGGDDKDAKTRERRAKIKEVRPDKTRCINLHKHLQVVTVIALLSRAYYLHTASHS